MCGWLRRTGPKTPFTRAQGQGIMSHTWRFSLQGPGGGTGAPFGRTPPPGVKDLAPPNGNGCERKKNALPRGFPGRDTAALVAWDLETGKLAGLASDPNCDVDEALEHLRTR